MAETLKLTTLPHDDVLQSMATKQDLKELEQSFTIRVGGMFVIAMGVLTAILKLSWARVKMRNKL
jgi:hypothetical protein